MSHTLILSDIFKSINSMNRMEPNFDILYDTLTEAAEGYERALMNIDKGEEYSDKELISKDLELQNVDQSFKESLKQHRYFLNVKKVLSELHQDISQGNIEAKDASAILAAKFDKLENNVDDEELNVDHEQKYLEFRQAVWNCRNPTTDFNEADDDSDDDGIRVMRHDIDVNCPLTRENIGIAYSTHCNHVYSEAIFKYIQENKDRSGKVRCVFVGCSEMIRKEDIKQDREATKKIKRRLKDMRVQEQIDVEDIIDF